MWLPSFTNGERSPKKKNKGTQHGFHALTFARGPGERFTSAFNQVLYVLDEILNLIESVSEGFPSYSFIDLLFKLYLYDKEKKKKKKKKKKKRKKKEPFV